jgi:hypothetical protein
MTERTDTETGDWQATWEDARSRRFVLGLDATPEERLAWLEEAIHLAHASGALPRPNKPKTPESFR